MPKYRNISIKTEFANSIEQFIRANPQFGYRSLAQFLEDSSRRRLEELDEPRFQKLNSDENGVKIWDSRLHKTAEVFFKPSGIRCMLDETSNCEHVYFALTFPDVRAIIKAKRKEGWKLPDV
jgi:hypothetical protein